MSTSALYQQGLGFAPFKYNYSQWSLFIENALQLPVVFTDQLTDCVGWSTVYYSECPASEVP